MLWSAILCWLGVKAGQDEALMRGELHRVTLWAAGALTVLGAMYYFLVQRQLPRTATTDLPTEKKP
jgi:membrane protein DedA with SNARE-associated domain